MKKYHEAVNILEQAKKLSPEEVVILNNLGSAYFNINEFKKARAEWAKVLEIQPLNKTARENLKTLDKMGE
jgi:Flp pilus assembly protein TadD